MHAKCLGPLPDLGSATVQLVPVWYRDWSRDRSKNRADGIARALTDSINDRCAQVWLAISGIAYDVTEFLAEHPGGEEVVMEVTGAGCCSHSPARLRRASRLPLATGKDATADFDDVGHSDEARGMMDGSNDTMDTRSLTASDGILQP